MTLADTTWVANVLPSRAGVAQLRGWQESYCPVEFTAAGQLENPLVYHTCSQCRNSLYNTASIPDTGLHSNIADEGSFLQK